MTEEDLDFILDKAKTEFNSTEFLHFVQLIGQYEICLRDIYKRSFVYDTVEQFNTAYEQTRCDKVKGNLCKYDCESIRMQIQNKRALKEMGYDGNIDRS